MEIFGHEYHAVVETLSDSKSGYGETGIQFFSTKGDTIKVSAWNESGDVATGHYDVADLMYEADGGRYIIDALYRVKGGDAIINTVVAACSVYFDSIKNTKWNNGVSSVQGWSNAISTLEEALGHIPEQFEGSRNLLDVVLCELLAYGMWSARLAEFETIRNSIKDEQEIASDIQLFVRTLLMELNMIRNASRVEIWGFLFLRSVYNESWRISHFSQSCRYSGELAEERADVRIAVNGRRVILHHGLMISPYRLDVASFLSPPGGGKTTIGKGLHGADEAQYRHTIFDDGQTVLHGMNDARTKDYLEYLALRERTMVPAVPETRASIKLLGHLLYEQYMSYRYVMAGSFRTKLIQLLDSLPENAEFSCIFETMAFDPFVAVLAEAIVEPFLKGIVLSNTDEPSISLTSVLSESDIIDMELGKDLFEVPSFQLEFPYAQHLGGMYNLRGAVEALILSHPKLIEAAQLTLGNCVVLDMPIPIHVSNVEKCTTERRDVRLRDTDLFPVFRAIHLVLAELFPNVDVLHNSYINGDGELVQLPLSRALSLADIIRTVLHLKNIAHHIPDRWVITDDIEGEEAIHDCSGSEEDMNSMLALIFRRLSLLHDRIPMHFENTRDQMANLS